MARRPQIRDTVRSDGEFEERVVNIKRCSKVVKGGRNFSFSALIVVGDRKGKVGVGLGKAREVAEAIRKGTDLARKNVISMPLAGQTLPHAIEAKFRGGHVWMGPAAPGTGLIAGGGMRAVLELAGVKDVLAKSIGTNNVMNVVKATMHGVTMLDSRESIYHKRGIKLEKPVAEIAEETVDEATEAEAADDKNAVADVEETADADNVETAAEESSKDSENKED